MKAHTPITTTRERLHAGSEIGHPLDAVWAVCWELDRWFNLDASLKPNPLTDEESADV
jgi:hypothetical protein